MFFPSGNSLLHLGFSRRRILRAARVRGSSPRVSLAFSPVTSGQTGEWLANQDGVLLIDLTPMGGEFRKRLRLFLGGWINLLKRGASGKKQDLHGIVTSPTLKLFFTRILSRQGANSNRCKYRGLEFRRRSGAIVLR